MARITVEDCLNHVENRFQLVLIAAKRARQLALTAVEPHVPWDHDKVTVVALREIAAGFTKFEDFKEVDSLSGSGKSGMTGAGTAIGASTGTDTEATDFG